MRIGSDRILLVDDNPRNLQMLLQFLGGRGHTLLVAKSGEAALEIAVKSRPAVILLDVMMPGIDGFETCRRLKADERTRDAAVLFLSAAGETEQKLAGFEAGGVDYITKPIQGEEVVARVNTHLTIRRLNVELQAKMSQIERELAVVQQMQRQLLPPALPRIDTLELAAHYSTSRYAGGDYYDVVALREGDGSEVPRRWGILVADVSGHGTPAAVTMAMTRTAFHARPELHADPAAVLRAINDHFEYLWEETGFVTALYGVYDAPARSLRFTAAGHPRPLLCRAETGRVEELCCEATVPLLIDRLDQIDVAEVTLAPGDHLLFYTDGIPERMNPAGEFYGVERLSETMQSARAGGAAETVRRIIESVEHFAAGRESADDQTLLLGTVM
jgi:phosphoserine phosphatase RsbU/P